MNCKELHNKAMDLAQQAADLYRKAYTFEKQAAMLLYDTDGQPARAILFRSAGWMAYNSNQLEEAKKMVEFGLMGSVPKCLKTELNELRIMINH